MTRLFVNYLFESSVCLIILTIVYRILLSRLTHFTWMRFYLMLSLVLSITLPIIILPVNWRASSFLPGIFNNLSLIQGNSSGYQDGLSASNNQQGGGINIQNLIYSALLIIYIAGVLYKMGTLVWNLTLIGGYIKQNPITSEENYRVVRINDSIPPFSFLNFIFLSANYKNISATDLQQIKDHEKVHVKQFHTIDLILVELSAVMFWFNPFIVYLKKSLQEIHEYIADEKTAGSGGSKKEYAALLLSLSSDLKSPAILNLTAGFTEPQIIRRLQAMIKKRSEPMDRLRFLILIPLTAVMLLSFSYIKTPDNRISETNGNAKAISTQQRIGRISWSGNTVYSSSVLNKALGIKSGEKYDKEDVLHRLGDKVASLYLDNGYVFHKCDLTTKIRNGRVDLNIFVTEGKKATVGEITVKGNTTVPFNEILKNITFKSGDFFSKEKIVSSIKSIAAMGKFDPEKINPQLTPSMKGPDQEFGVIDVLFEVTEIKK
jgi:hypothetical protein